MGWVVDVHDFPTMGAHEASADEVLIQDRRCGNDSSGAHVFVPLCTTHSDFLSHPNVKAWARAPLPFSRPPIVCVMAV